MKKYLGTITLGLVCFILTIAIFIQIKTINDATTTVGTTISDNSELIDEVLSWQEKYEKEYEKLEKAEEELESVRNQAVSGSTEDAESEAEIKETNKILGLTEVTGDGIVIVLDENRNAETDEVLDVNKLLVHEEDLLQIVNELFNAGADAISINEQRIVSTTSILCDGNILRINGQIVGVPITIKAIGHQGALWNLLRPQGYLQLMADDGVIVTPEKVQNIVIPKYDGVFSYSCLSKDDNS